MEGYNIALKLNGKTIVGRTQDDLTIAAKIKESLSKDDAGETQYSVNGHDVTIKASALAEVNNSVATKIDRDDVIELALKKGSQAVIPIVYEVTGGDAYQGNAIITNYTESSNASDDANISVDLRVTGSFTKVTTVVDGQPA